MKLFRIDPEYQKSIICKVGNVQVFKFSRPKGTRLDFSNTEIVPLDGKCFIRRHGCDDYTFFGDGFSFDLNEQELRQLACLVQDQE